MASMPAPSRPAPSWPRRAFAHARRALPEGRELPGDEWRARHRAILAIIFLHAIGIAAFGLWMAQPWPLALGEGALVAALGAVAAWPRTKRRFRAAVAAFALVFSSAAIVQFSGGYIEAHFHFFVMLAVIALYQDWAPFLLAIVYVAADHGIVGTLFPTLVYNHGDAYAHPWKWALIHASLVLGESVALLMGWKVAETARRRTALVLDSAGEGILGLDLDGRITFANPAAAAMTQIPIDALHGEPIERFLDGGVTTARPSGPWLPEHALAEDATMRVVRADGSHVAVEWEQTPILNNGAMIGSVLTLRDITERKRAEESLRRAVSTLTATLESTTDGILVIDQSGRIAGFNRRFVELWGLPMSVLGSGSDEQALQFVSSQLVDPEAFVAKVRQLYAHPDATSFDELDFKDGRILERYSQPQRSGDAIIGRVWSFRDVTERRKADKALRDQESLQAMNEHLREIDRLKTQFINNAAHELGTPLTPIKLQTHMLNNGTLGPLSDRQANSVRVLSRNVDHLQLVLRDVVDCARIQAGRLEVKLEPTRLDRVVAEAVESFSEAAAQQGVTLALETAPDVVAHADARRLTQVMFNLLRNALKFTPRSGKVRVRLAREGDRATIEVADDGAGIDPALIGKLFQPFSQVHDKMQRTDSGAGLGLYISQGIMESHGGQLSCESAGLGRGATFRMTLPTSAVP